MLKTTFQGIEYRFFDHLFAVSRCGKFLRKLEPFEPVVNRKDGYINLGRHRLAHRVVATCWCERPEGATHVHHINEDKSDNRADNLEWVTPKEHMGERHEGLTRGHTMSEEGKQRLRTLRLGMKASEETKQKQREAALRLGLKPPPRPLGMKMSDESRTRMSENSPNAQACVVDGVTYASFNEAGKALGMKPHSLRKRCYSLNFPSFQLGK
jgi:hypothetical protein